jgi:LmbE family N-acetylglucosaminyl deacetylase
MSRILVLSPHPDDEAIGCGGALCGHADRGDDVKVVFLTSGEAGGHGADPADAARAREAEAQQAARVLGVRRLEFWRLPDGRLAANEQACRRLAALMDQEAPDLVYTCHPGEQHPDHRACAALLRQVLAVPGTGRPAVRLFEVWTPLGRIDHVEDISARIERKLRAIRAYASQNRVLKFDEAIAGLNRYRGEMHSWPGGDYAEVFMGMRP